MPFPPGPFDPTFDPSFPNNSVSTSDREWFANLFNFSRVPWDVLFLFGLFTAIVGFLIAHWWLTQRMRKYKDRIRILDHEDAALESIYPREEEGSFPVFKEEGGCVPRDPNLVKSEPPKSRVRFSDPLVEEEQKKPPPVASVPIKIESVSTPEEPSIRTEDKADVTVVPPPEPSPPIDVSEKENPKPEPSTEKKKGKTTPSSRTKKTTGSTKKQEKSESVSEIATVSDS